jgi:hypothetical protein
VLTGSAILFPFVKKKIMSLISKQQQNSHLGVPRTGSMKNCSLVQEQILTLKHWSVCVCVCGAGDGTQGFGHARQMLYHWAPSPAPKTLLKVSGNAYLIPCSWGYGCVGWLSPPQNGSWFQNCLSAVSHVLDFTATIRLYVDLDAPTLCNLHKNLPT